MCVYKHIRTQEALQQLEELSHGWPKEPNIYISKGKVSITCMYGVHTILLIPYIEPCVYVCVCVCVLG